MAEENDGGFLSEEKSAAGTEAVFSSNEQNNPEFDTRFCDQSRYRQVDISLAKFQLVSERSIGYFIQHNQ